jgi:hypothetical protein
MALQLSRTGESVELLALLEAVTPQVPMRRWLATKKHFGDMLTQARNRRRFAKWAVVVGVFRELVNPVKSGRQGNCIWNSLAALGRILQF